MAGRNCAHAGALFEDRSRPLQMGADVERGRREAGAEDQTPPIKDKIVTVMPFLSFFLLLRFEWNARTVITSSPRVSLR
jgi:hypothetical protein